MRHRSFLALLCISSSLYANVEKKNSDLRGKLAYKASWLVVGGGPAGISAVAALCDAKVKPEEIIWLDDTFNVGDLGNLYANVPANSSRNAFLNYFSLSPYLMGYAHYADHLKKQSQSDCFLQEIVIPLKRISKHLRKKVASVCDHIDMLAYQQETKTWRTELAGVTLQARNVILATGAHPKALPLKPPNAQQLPFEVALDKEKLASLCIPLNQEIVVVGSSHSAALILKNLVELEYSNIVHIYKHDFRLRQKTEHGELFPFSGLKGPVKKWVQKNLTNKTHSAMRRLHSDSPEAEKALNQCSAYVNAIGFEPNNIPIHTKDLYTIPKEAHEIGPHLYGIGIAFPTKVTDVQGNLEAGVGLISFMQTLKKYLPVWLNTANK